MISHTKEIIIKVSVYDVEKLIHDFYGRSIDITSDLELGNQVIEVDIKNRELDLYHLKQIKEFRANNNFFYITYTLLDDMCGWGLLEEGNYLIDCTW